MAVVGAGGVVVGAAVDGGEVVGVVWGGVVVETAVVRVAKVGWGGGVVVGATVDCVIR